MWTLGHSVKETERSADHVVVVETATMGAVAIFGASALLSLVIYKGIPSAILAFFSALWGLYSAVTSSFIADRTRNVLVIRRKLLLWTIERVHSVDDVSGVYVRDTWRHGSGLVLRFKSGRSKNLTMSLGFDANLDGVASALNHYLRKPRGR